MTLPRHGLGGWLDLSGVVDQQLGTFLMTPPTEARMRFAMDPAAHLGFRHGNKQNSKVL